MFGNKGKRCGPALVLVHIAGKSLVASSEGAPTPAPTQYQ